MSDALIDDGARTSPGFDTLDPSQIDGDTLRISQETHGFSAIVGIMAPGVALPEDALYVLKFKVASPWRNLPGSSNSSPTDGDGWIEMEFSPGAAIGRGYFPVQIIEIDKAGSTAGDWIVFG